MILSAVLPSVAIPRKNLRAALKALSWRAVGALDTLAVSFVVSGSFKMAAGIMGVEFFTKVALYYVHERVWDDFR